MKNKIQLKKAVVCYSGGLDTSVILCWLKEHYGCQVVACCVDVGQREDWGTLKVRALKTGASRFYCVDAKKEFVTDFLLHALQAHAVYEGKYLLGTALARPLIASKVVEVARREKAGALVHGATGKGNDQVRFELAFQALAPELKIIAPWREWDIHGRAEAMAYAKSHRIPVPVTPKAPYSSDANLWHISYEGGILEDPNRVPDKEMFQLTVSPEAAPSQGALVRVKFYQGVPTHLNGHKMDPVVLVRTLNRLAGKHGVGRVDMVENRLVGIKSRGVYESPAATVLYAAHRELESLVLDRETAHAKEGIGPRYGELIYNGQWYSPLREALDAFVKSTQKWVTGEITLQLYKGTHQAVGRQSPHSLYKESLATFERDTLFDHKDAGGFIRLFGLPLFMHAQKHLLK